jgi:hypothetical protein
MARRLLRSAAPRTPAVASAIEVAFSKSARGSAGSPGRRRHRTSAAAGFQGAVIDKSIAEADRMVFGTGGVEALGQEDPVVARHTVDMAH